MAKKKVRSIERAAQSNDAYRLLNDIPLLTDTTELISPGIAQEWLEKYNTRNHLVKSVDFKKVDEIKKLMLSGKWIFHGQGIMFDWDGNLLTGQKRLMAIVYSGIPQYFRISRGNPPDSADVIDRGLSQTSVDLASRVTRRLHSPTEKKMARDIYAMSRQDKPSEDDIANLIKSYSDEFKTAMESTRGTKKTRGVIMIMATICYLNENEDMKSDAFILIPEKALQLETVSSPLSLKTCWRRPAEHTAIMKRAIKICKQSK